MFFAADTTPVPPRLSRLSGIPGLGDDVQPAAGLAEHGGAPLHFVRAVEGGDDGGLIRELAARLEVGEPVAAR